MSMKKLISIALLLLTSGLHASLTMVNTKFVNKTNMPVTFLSYRDYNGSPLESVTIAANDTYSSSFNAQKTVQYNINLPKISVFTQTNVQNGNITYDAGQNQLALTPGSGATYTNNSPFAMTIQQSYTTPTNSMTLASGGSGSGISNNNSITITPTILNYTSNWLPITSVASEYTLTLDQNGNIICTPINTKTCIFTNKTGYTLRFNSQGQNALIANNTTYTYNLLPTNNFTISFVIESTFIRYYPPTILKIQNDALTSSPGGTGGLTNNTPFLIHTNYSGYVDIIPGKAYSGFWPSGDNVYFTVDTYSASNIPLTKMPHAYTITINNGKINLK